MTKVLRISIQQEEKRGGGRLFFRRFNSIVKTKYIDDLGIVYLCFPFSDPFRSSFFVFLSRAGFLVDSRTGGFFLTFFFLTYIFLTGIFLTDIFIT